MKTEGTYKFYYVLKDHLGSWTTITDSQGNVEQELSFDACGTRRNPETWQSSSQLAAPMFDRGFTGHEHLYAFGLINMNGRCYDPLTSSFLSVDAYVQNPASAQAFNRYAYCGHNPLRYTDPTGWYQRPESYGINPNLNPGGHTTYYSDDPNDVLWGRTSHPWSNSSSGYINGTAYTITRFTKGTQLPKIVFAGKDEEEAYNEYREEVFKYDTEEYKIIQEELICLENASEEFCIRMGDNVTSEAGGGNFIYNEKTDQIDVNLSNYGIFNTIEKISHELKHAYQYMERKLGFDILTGEVLAYDINDELEAYARQRMFGNTFSENQVRNSLRYSKLPNMNYNLTIDQLHPRFPFNKMKQQNKKWQEYNKVRFIYHGWQNDIQ